MTLDSDSEDSSTREPLQKRSRWASDDSFILCAVVTALLLSATLTIVDDARVALAGWIVPESCALKRVTNIPCPGCGLTRSFIRLAHGDWSDSLRFHRLGWLLFALAILQIPYRLLRLADRVAPHPKWGLRMMMALIGLLAINWAFTLLKAIGIGR